MKSIVWIGGIVAAGLLVGYSLRLIASPAAPPKPAAAAAAISASANPDHAQYQVGDKLQQKADANAPYQPSAKKAGEFQEVAWESLIPKDWDPMKPFKGLQLDKMDDGDPRAMEALEKAKKYWQSAPIDPKMDGIAIRIPGFVVSLEREGDALREFLLVPYFGACIHVPPPPSNQVIHVRSAKAAKDIRTMDPVWISGVLKVDRSDTMMGSAGYSMAAVKLEPYTTGEDR